MKNKKILIGLIVLLLAVGFAAVTTTLYINGRVTYQTNKDDFNVIYTGAVSSEENLTTSKTNDKASAVIESDKKHITFSTQDLAVVGEWARVDYEITNYSRNYDANVTVSWTLDNSADQAFYNEYLEIENHENWTGSIEAGTSETGWVKVSVKKAYLGDEDNNPKEIKFTVTYKADAVSRETLGDGLPDKPVVLVPGLYDEDNNLLVKWEDSGIDVEKDYGAADYYTESASASYIILNNYPTAKKAIIPEGTNRIGNYAFRKCSVLTSVEFPSTLTSIGNSAFLDCTGLINVKVPEGVTTIEKYAFNMCKSLESAELPSTLTSLGDSAFLACSKLTSVNIPNGITTIGAYTFSGCSSLPSIELPDSITSIGSWAFKDCSSMTSIKIPYNITKIKARVFEGCTGLTSVIFENPNNWKRGTTEANATQAVSSEDMANSTTVATFLTDTYVNNVFLRTA